MGWSRTIAPNGSPIHLDEAKLHLRETGSDQDSLISAWTAAALDASERYTNRVLLHSRFALTIDAFPRASSYWRAPVHIARVSSIVLPHVPVVRVVSVAYTDSAGDAQTVSSANYRVNTDREPVTVTPVNGYSWPATLDEEGAVVVTYDAGYASVVTADATGNTLTAAGPVTWAVDDIVRVWNSGGALPGGLSAATNYYIKTASSGVYTLAATAGGSAIDITSAGTGHTFLGSELPQSMIAWAKLRLAALYENREETDETGRLKMIPFADGLLNLDRVIMP